MSSGIGSSRSFDRRVSLWGHRHSHLLCGREERKAKEGDYGEEGAFSVDCLNGLVYVSRVWGGFDEA